MQDIKLQRLKEVLAIPTYSRNEELMIEYLENVLTEKGYEYQKDRLGNIFVTKGKSENFPCFVSHTDTVHYVNPNLKVVQLEEDGKTILTGIDSKTLKPSGIGGDDKCGVYLCLEMLDTLENVKIVFFVSEEIGCIGSREAVESNPKFFKNIGYAIQYDSPKGNSMSMSLMGKDLFNKKSEFGERVSPLILEHGITDWAKHPYTDIWPLIDTFGFSCLNLAAGYHRYHTAHEYVVVEEVENAFELGIKIYNELGENFYGRTEKVVTKVDYLFNDEETSVLLTEDEDLFFDEDEDGYEYDDYNDVTEEYTYTSPRHYPSNNDSLDHWDYDGPIGGKDRKTITDEYSDHTIEFDW
jgi:putative aminopeptidase FrvX